MAEGIRTKCDFCDKPADYDSKTCFGPWGFLCEEHYQQYGSKVEGLYKRLSVTECKECRICHRRLPVADFYTYIDHNGIERYRNECKACNLKRRKV